MVLVTAVIAIGVLGLASVFLGGPLLDSDGDDSSEPALAALVLEETSPAPAAEGPLIPAAGELSADIQQAQELASSTESTEEFVADTPPVDTHPEGDALGATPAPEPVITQAPVAPERDRPEVEVEPPREVAAARSARPEVAETAPDDVPPAAIRLAQPNTWVCNGEVRVEDPRGRRWSVNKVSFLPRDGYERVVLHLERTGPGGGALATVTAQAFDTSAIRRYVAGAAKPGSGRTTVGVHLLDGIASAIGLRRYRPRGMQTVKEFSVYPAARSSSKVLITSAGDGCFRLRAPAWESDDGVSLQKAQILIDVRR